MNRFTRLIAGAASAFAMLGVGLVVSAPPASAGFWESCPTNEFCVYKDISYDGTFRAMTYSAPNYTTVWLKSSTDPSWGHINDMASSVVAVGLKCALNAYEHADYSGRYLAFGSRYRAGTVYRDPDLRNGGGQTWGTAYSLNMNDALSSHKFVDCR